MDNSEDSQALHLFPVALTPDENAAFRQLVAAYGGDPAATVRAALAREAQARGVPWPGGGSHPDLVSAL